MSNVEERSNPQSRTGEPLQLTITEDKLVVVSEEQLERLCEGLPVEWMQQLKQKRRALKRLHKSRSEARQKEEKVKELRRQIADLEKIKELKRQIANLDEKVRNLEDPCADSSTM